MLRGRSKEAKDRNRKVTPPGPVYMSNDQFGMRSFHALPALQNFEALLKIHITDTNTYQLIISPI